MLASRGPCSYSLTSGRRGTSRGPIPFVKIPIEAVCALFIFWNTLRHLVVLHQNICDYELNLVVAQTWAPTKVVDGVVEAHVTGMAFRLHRVSTYRAKG